MYVQNGKGATELVLDGQISTTNMYAGCGSRISTHHQQMRQIYEGRLDAAQTNRLAQATTSEDTQGTNLALLFQK